MSFISTAKLKNTEFLCAPLNKNDILGHFSPLVPSKKFTTSLPYQILKKKKKKKNFALLGYYAAFS
jgi:hypothetical protein